MKEKEIIHNILRQTNLYETYLFLLDPNKKMNKENLQFYHFAEFILSKIGIEGKNLYFDGNLNYLDLNDFFNILITEYIIEYDSFRKKIMLSEKIKNKLIILMKNYLLENEENL